MANASISQMHELAVTAENVGYEAKDFAALSNNRNLMKQVLMVIRGVCEIVAKKLPIWLRVKVGGLSKEKIIEKLDNIDAGSGLMFKLGDWARDILGKKECTVTKEVEEADFAIVALKDLGFDENPMTKQFLNDEFLAKFNLELCRPDDSPSLRLAYTDQPDGEWLPIAMRPIRDSGGDWHVFSLIRDGSELWLFTVYFTAPELRWGLDDRFVFRVRKVKS